MTSTNSLAEIQLLTDATGNATKEMLANVTFDGLDDSVSCSGTMVHYLTVILLFVFGALGNILSVVIMQRRALRERNYSPALRVLAFFNTLTLFVQAMQAADTITKEYYGSMESYFGVIGCKLYRFLPTVIQLIDHWMVVFITAQRFTPICVPKLAIFHIIFADTHTKAVFTVMFCVVTATQMWRPFMDTMLPAAVTIENGTMAELQSATCTAMPLELYIDIDFFFYQFALLFLFPALFILLMNIGVIVKLYQSYNRRIVTETTVENARDTEQQTADQVEFAESRFLTEVSSGVDGPDSLEMRIKRIRQATVFLLAVTCTFWMYIMPHLFLLTYVVLNKVFFGKDAGGKALIKVCQASNITSILAALSCADFFVIQYIFDELFRLQLKLAVYRLLGRCFRSCRARYIKGRRKHRRLVSGSSYMSSQRLPPGLSPQSTRLTQLSADVERHPAVTSSMHKKSVSFNTIADKTNAVNVGDLPVDKSDSAVNVADSNNTNCADLANNMQYPSRLVVYLYVKEGENQSLP